MRYWPVYGGGETITVSLANEFVKRGHNVFIAYQFEKNSDPMPYEIDSRIKTVKLHTIEKFRTEDVSLLRNYIESNSIDVMINQWGDSELCNKARQGTSCKFITCWHLDVLRKQLPPCNRIKKFLYMIAGSKVKNWIDKSRQLKLHKKNYENSDRYIFLSPSFAKEYIALANLPLQDLKVGAISNPLTYDIEYDVSNYQQKKKKVLFVGRIFEYHKRLSYVLKIWSEIEKNSFLNDWSLDIVGDGPDMAETKLLSENLNLKRVAFVGFKRPMEYYERSSIFVMTSLFEGFGMTLVEAQQNACVPIVMNSYRSLHDIIVDGRNGLIVENDNLLSFVEKLSGLMLDAEKRFVLAKKGLESCKMFNIKSIANAWEKEFSNLKMS